MEEIETIAERGEQRGEAGSAATKQHIEAEKELATTLLEDVQWSDLRNCGKRSCLCSCPTG
jgi:hypothetical protein